MNTKNLQQSNERTLRIREIQKIIQKQNPSWNMEKTYWAALQEMRANQQ